MAVDEKRKYHPPKTAKAWLALFQIANGRSPTMSEFQAEMPYLEDTDVRNEEWYAVRRELLKAVGLPED